MKRYTLLLIALLTAAACKEKDELAYPLPPPLANGSCIAPLNDGYWQPDEITYNAHSFYPGRLSLVMSTNRRQQLHITNINPDIAEIQLFAPDIILSEKPRYLAKQRRGDTCYAMFHLTNGDVSEDSYRVDEKAANKLTILRYDAKKRILEGRFTVRLYRLQIEHHPIAAQGMKDTLQFTNVSFIAPLDVRHKE